MSEAVFRISYCLVLVKRSLTKEFKSTKGLRKDILNLIFFSNIGRLKFKSTKGKRVEKVYHRMVRQAVKKHIYNRLKIGKRNTEGNLLQFVDDTIFGCEANIHNFGLR